MLRGVGDVGAVLIVAGGFAAVLYGFMLLAQRIRRRGLGGPIMGPIDEIYHPAAHRIRFQIEVQEQHLVPMPSPDGPAVPSADD